MKFNLKELRLRKNIPARDMVDVVKELYPKYDKTIQSKCENGEAYGVCLLPGAENAITRKFAPELQRKKDGHRLTCRISCRLETVEYKQLMQNIKSDGFATTQDWLTDIVKRYNIRKAYKNESCNN